LRELGGALATLETERSKLVRLATNAEEQLNALQVGLHTRRI